MYKKNISILYTTHILEELNYADKILYLKEGKVVYYGSSEEFRKKLPTYKLTIDNKVNKYFLTSKDALTYLEKHPKLLNSLFEIKKVDYKDIFTYLGRGKNA